MIEQIKPIANIYTVKQFNNILKIYCKMLTPVLIITFFLCLISLKPQIFEDGIFEPYRSYLLIAITISAIVFSPYLLYILFIEKKKKWILSFFIFVIIPFTLAYMLFQQFIFTMMGAFFPVLFYWIYCLFLKTEVQRWLDHSDWIQRRSREESERKKLEIMGPF